MGKLIRDRYEAAFLRDSATLIYQSSSHPSLPISALIMNEMVLSAGESPKALERPSRVRGAVMPASDWGIVSGRHHFLEETEKRPSWIRRGGW